MDLLDNPIVKPILYFIAVIIILYILYRFYRRWLQNQSNKPVFYIRPNIYGLYRNTMKPDMIKGSKIVPSNIGLEYSYSVWIKVDNFNYKFGKPKHIFHKGPQDISVCNPGLFIAPKTNQLIIRVDTDDSNSVFRSAKNRRVEGTPIQTLYDVEVDDCIQACAKNKDCNTFSLDQLANQCTFFSNKVEIKDGTELNKLPQAKDFTSFVKQKSMNPNYYEKYELNHNLPCDIIDMPLQRWNHVVLVLWNRSFDVYLNGKLARSCTLNKIPNINKDNLYVTQEGGYDGDMANLQYFNEALNAERVYDLYKHGLEGSSKLKIATIIPKVNFSISASADVSTSEIDGE